MRLTRDRVPPAIAGTPPRWWPTDDPAPLAFGPFAVERADSGMHLGVILQYAGPDEAEPTATGALKFSVADRALIFPLRRDPYVANGKIHVRTTTAGRMVIRPLRDGDRRWLSNADNTTVVDRDLVEAARRSFGW